jgi:hypothetical protein
MDIQEYVNTIMQVKQDQGYVKTLFSMMKLQADKKIKESTVKGDMDFLTILQDIQEYYNIDTFLGSIKTNIFGKEMYQPTLAEMVLFFELSFEHDETITSSVITHRMDDERMILFLSFDEYHSMNPIARMNWLQDMLLLFKMEVTQQPQFVV